MNPLSVPGPRTEQHDDGLDDVLGRSIRDVRALLDTRELSPVELVGACLDRIAARNPRLGALSHVAEEQAVVDARESADRLARGRPLGPLEGIVVAVKDLVEVRGMPLEAGSAVLSGRLGNRDAAVVAALRRSGAVVGMASMDEFALTTVGPARNPLDHELMAGGSSGGSAVAVAAGMCFAAIGTDTGGSVRIPAECCAVTGFKPTQALLPTDGVLALAPSLDHVGTLARTVDDTAVFLDALLPGRPHRGVPPPPEPASSWRVGVPADLSGYAPSVVARFREAIEHAAGRGARIETVDLPGPEETAEAHYVIILSEMAAYHHGRFGTAEDRYRAPVRDGIATGAGLSAEQYAAAQELRGTLRRRVDALFDEVDVLALPTMTVDTPRYGQATVPVGGADTDPTAAMVAGTRLFNHTGHPAVNVPPATRRPGAPAGIQLAAPHFRDRALLAAARIVES